MVVRDLANIQGFSQQCISDEPFEISDAYTGDLLSDVMGNAPSDSVLMTIQAHKNTVAVASLAQIRCRLQKRKRSPSLPLRTRSSRPVAR